MRLLPPLILAVGLLCSLMLLLFPPLFTSWEPAPVLAQDKKGGTAVQPLAAPAATPVHAADSAADHHLYLPQIQQGSGQDPTPVPTPVIKTKSGIHLGNRGASDWREELFTWITGTVTGTWPAAVVIRSDQLFSLDRATTEPCRITDATLKLTGEGEPYNAFKYLDAAIHAGTKMIIRIAPSPGNFVDYEYLKEYVEETALSHTLLVDDQPAGENYCDESEMGGSLESRRLRPTGIS